MDNREAAILSSLVKPRGCLSSMNLTQCFITEVISMDLSLQLSGNGRLVFVDEAAELVVTRPILELMIAKLLLKCSVVLGCEDIKVLPNSNVFCGAFEGFGSNFFSAFKIPWNCPYFSSNSDL